MKLLFLTPHMALWPHALPEAILARALSENGHEVSYITCNKAQTYCAAMTAARYAPGQPHKDVARICKQCVSNTRSIEKAYGFSTAFFTDYLTDDDYAKCRELSDAAVRTRSFETKHMGVNVGKLCLFETTLMHKKISLEYTDEQWFDYGIYLYNALIAVSAFAGYLKQHHVDAVLAYCPQYSNVNSSMELAKLRGIRTIFLHAGPNLGHRLGSMIVWDWAKYKLLNPALQHWGSIDQHRVRPQDAKRLGEHFRELLNGKSFAVYSSPFEGSENIRRRWNIKPHQKILVATTSSLDERFANHLIGAWPPDIYESKVFKDQLMWLQSTIDWIRNRSDVFLIIRQHPRDFPNKRESKRSEQSYLYEKAFVDLPPNVVVNLPSDDVSFYGMLDQTDVLLTGWSSTATEALMLGIPVVTYDSKLPQYPAEITYTGSSQKSYFQQIEKALADGWSFENVRKAFRWLSYLYEQVTISISPRVGRFELSGKKVQDRYEAFLRSWLPKLSRYLELRNWRTALAGANIVHLMLMSQKSSILDVIKPSNHDFDDEEIIRDQLKLIFDLIYGASSPNQDEKTVRSNIDRFLRKTA